MSITTPVEYEDLMLPRSYQIGDADLRRSGRLGRGPITDRRQQSVLLANVVDTGPGANRASYSTSHFLDRAQLLYLVDESIRTRTYVLVKGVFGEPRCVR